MAVIFSDFLSYGKYFLLFIVWQLFFQIFFILWQLFFYFSSYGRYFFIYEKIRSTDNMKWVNRRKLVLMWKILFMEECASILYATSDKNKAGSFSWFVNLFWRLLNFSSQTFCFFSGGLRPFWDFLAWERPSGLSKAKKFQKGRRPSEKTKCLRAEAENNPKQVDKS